MSRSNSPFTEHDANILFGFEPGKPHDSIFFREFLSTFKQVPGKPAPVEKADQHAPFRIESSFCTRLPTSESDTLDATSKIPCNASTTVPYGAMLRCQKDLVFMRQLGTFAWQVMRELVVVPSLPTTAVQCVVCSKPYTQSTEDADVTVTNKPELSLLLRVDPVYFVCSRPKCMAKTMQAKQMSAKAKERWRLCASCKKYEPIEGPKFPECARCKVEIYCGRDCQRSHWPDHRKICKQVTKPSSTTTSSKKK